MRETGEQYTTTPHLHRAEEQRLRLADVTVALERERGARDGRRARAPHERRVQVALTELFTPNERPPS